MNSGGRKGPFCMIVKHSKPGPNRVGESDEREIVAIDEDWVEEKDIEWLKGCFLNFLPSNRSIPEEELRDLWGKLNDAIGCGRKVKIDGPVAQLLSIKR